MTQDKYNAKATLSTKAGDVTVYKLDALKDAGIGHVDKLPYSIKVLLESCLRNHDDYVVTDEHIESLANYDAKNVAEAEIPFKPGRVVLQDFTGVPAVVDLAALRSAMARMTSARRRTACSCSAALAASAADALTLAPPMSK